MVTDCHQFKLPANHGKIRVADVASAETLLRLVQSVPGPLCRAYAILTNVINQEWSGVTVKDHKAIKGLKKQSVSRGGAKKPAPPRETTRYYFWLKA